LFKPFVAFASAVFAASTSALAVFAVSTAVFAAVAAFAAAASAAVAAAEEAEALSAAIFATFAAAVAASAEAFATFVALVKAVAASVAAVAEAFALAVAVVSTDAAAAAAALASATGLPVVAPSMFLLNIRNKNTIEIKKSINMIILLKYIIQYTSLIFLPENLKTTSTRSSIEISGETEFSHIFMKKS
jgi:hypothetical protein